MLRDSRQKGLTAATNGAAMTDAGRAVVLLSGGIDSSTTLAQATSEGYECYALSFDYAQRHAVELAAARRVAETLGVKEHLVISFDMRSIGGSALTSGWEVPEARGAATAERALAGMSQVPLTYVPARNTIFLSFALAWAEVKNASEIFIGANIVDYSGYPDCRPEYLRAFEDLANLATRVSSEGRLRFKVKAPLLFLTKPEIIKRGLSLGLDYSMTWSCYDPQDAGGQRLRPCARCESCSIRAKGFRDAGVQDPLLSIPR